MNLWKRRGRKTHETAPDGYRIVHFPPQVSDLLRLYGTGGYYSTLYKRQPNVRAAVDVIAREGAELSLKMYEKVPRSELLPSARLELNDHPMALLLDEPAPGMPTYDFYFATFADIATYDRCLWRVIRQRGVPKALVRIPPAWAYPERDPVSKVILFWRMADGTTVPNDDIIPFWGYDPDSNESGISPLESLRSLLADEFAATAFRASQWNGGLKKDGVIERDVDAPMMSDSARESFMIDVEDAMTLRPGTPLMLEPGMKWKDVAWSSKDMEYLGARKLNRTEVAAAYHMPAAMLMALENEDPSEATLKFFYKSTLPPILSRVESTVESKLLPMFDLSPAVRKYRYVEFNLDAKLRGSPEEQASIMATAAGGPVITVNEARARLNLPPLPGSDLIFVPLNSIRGGGPQAGPQNPTETPANTLEPVGTTPGGGSQQDIQKMLEATDAKAHQAKNRADQKAFLQEHRPRLEARFERSLLSAFGKQRDVAITGRDLDKELWDKRLADDLFGLAYQTVTLFGEMAAKEIEGDWLPERTVAYIRKAVSTDAQAINDYTLRHLDGEDVNYDALFGEGRAGVLAADYTTRWLNWAILEAGRQNGELE